MQTYTPTDMQYIQIMIWCLQLLLAHAPAIDPDWSAHWAAIMTGAHFAGEYWHELTGQGRAHWWADLIDELLDYILPWRADH